MKAFRWRSLVTLIVAIGVLLSAWLSLGQLNDNVDVDQARLRIAFWSTTSAAAFLLLLAISSLFIRRAWLAGLRLLVGIWLVVSPWILSQTTELIPTLVLITGGIAIVAVAAFDLYRDVRHEGELLSHMS